MNLDRCLALYRKTLLENVIPFWMRHAMDEQGGINTCIRDNGQWIERDKWAWSQWRAVWVFCKLYNAIEPRNEWLDTARGIYEFTSGAGTVSDGHWPLLLSASGEVLRGFESIYVDGFAIYGLTELYRATGDKQILDAAVRTFEAVQRTLHSDHPPPGWPYEIPVGWMAHGVSMIFSLAFHELALVSGAAEVRAAAEVHHRRVMTQFLRPERRFVLEWLTTGGNECPPPKGAAVCPGHAIESMWFQMHIARHSGDRETLETAVATIRFHLEQGWDTECGGLRLAIDAEGRAEVGWPHADTKLWWPHTEALYATLLAYEFSRQAWPLEWHERVRQYSYAHFPVPEHGEWRQKLNRQGAPINEDLFLPVKDPFHLPRALIYSIETLERMIGAGH